MVISRPSVHEEAHAGMNNIYMQAGFWVRIKNYLIYYSERSMERIDVCIVEVLSIDIFITLIDNNGHSG